MNLKTNLSNEEINNFLHHISHAKMEKLGEITAVELLKKYVDNGSSLEEIFKEGKVISGLKSGFFLESSRDKDRGYRIKFGYTAGPDAGDGGEWLVSFDDKNQIKDCVIDSAYIA